MKAFGLLALLAVTSPAFAQGDARKPTAPAQDQKPFIYDAIMGKQCFSPPDQVAHTAAPVCGAPTAKAPEPKPAPKPQRAAA